MMSDQGISEDSLNDVDAPKQSNLPKVLLLSAIVAVLIVTFVFLWGGKDQLRKVRAGYAAPDFTFRDLSFKDVSLSQYKGKIVLLNLWSTTCPPCIDEVPYFENLYQKMKGNEGFQLLTVVTNRGEDATVVKTFMDKHGLHFPALVDTKKVVYSRYKLTGWPETFLIGKDGIILDKFVGPKEWDSPQFIDRLNKLTKG
ncbi:MAG: TlpA family protein disulfide reductase [Proteobacteria bacterium]|nr:TlpA family protein disulfide reductase [Pseudomonadota bacterium]